jgi:hypothetical protein
LGVFPYWGLWKCLFFLKRHRHGGEVYAVGGVDIQSRGDVVYFNLKQPESVQNWRKRWFYIRDEHTPSQEFGLPEFSATAAIVKRKTWKHRLSTVEESETAPLLAWVEALQTTAGKEVSGLHLISTFLRRRIQPLQSRIHAMWLYTGVQDPTHVHNEDFSTNELETRMRAITNLTSKDSCGGRPPVTPYGGDKALSEVN